MTRFLKASLVFILLFAPKVFSEDAPPSPQASPSTTGTPAAEGVPSPEAGPYGCEGVISFRWKPSIQADKETTPSPDSPDSSYQETAFGTIRATGATEADGGKAIEAKVPGESSRAMARCRELHENLSGCVSAKFASSASVLSSLSFSARQELERAIQSDCQKQVGVCLASNLGPVTCKPLPKVQEAEGEGEEKDSKGGDKDKDKDKDGKKKK